MDPLEKVPLDELRAALPTLSINEQIGRALASPVLASRIKECRLKYPSIHIYLDHRCPNIHICQVRRCQGKEDLPWSRRQFSILSRAAHVKYPATMTLEEYCYREPPARQALALNPDDPWRPLIEHVEWLIDMFGIRHIGIRIDREVLTKEMYDRLLVEPLFKRCNDLRMWAERWTEEVLDDFFENVKMPVLVELMIHGFMPDDYNHPKAFSYPSVFYEDARWYTLQNLLCPPRISQIISVGLNDMTNEALNVFLSVWSGQQQDGPHRIDFMFRRRIDYQEVLKGLGHFPLRGGYGYLLFRKRAHGVQLAHLMHVRKQDVLPLGQDINLVVFRRVPIKNSDVGILKLLDLHRGKEAYLDRQDFECQAEQFEEQRKKVDAFVASVMGARMEDGRAVFN